MYVAIVLVTIGYDVSIVIGRVAGNIDVANQNSSHLNAVQTVGLLGECNRSGVISGQSVVLLTSDNLGTTAGSVQDDSSLVINLYSFIIAVLVDGGDGILGSLSVLGYSSTSGVSTRTDL